MLPRCLMLTIKKRIAPLSAQGGFRFGARYLNPPRLSTSILFGLGLMLLSGCADPGPRALMQGERLLREGSYSAAIHELEKAAHLLPRDARAWNHLGLAYHHAGRLE